MNSPDDDMNHSNQITWENHTCMPLQPGHSFMTDLSRYRKANVDVVSLNITFDLMTFDIGFRVVSFVRDWVRQHPGLYALAASVDDILQNKRDGKLSILFDIEGLKSIGEQLDLIDTYYSLGVRWASPTYNNNNQFGGGCLDDDTGLTPLGKRLIQRMNAVGMAVCCSHMGERSSLEIISESSKPVIFSHSNVASLYPHRRNISDASIKSCAARGGVVGINGIGIFLGRNDTSVETFLRHICYVADLVGVEHVGISLDYAFDLKEVEHFFTNNRDMFPENEYGSTLEMVQPEVYSVVESALISHGMSQDETRLVLGENWLRIAKHVWC